MYENPCKRVATICHSLRTVGRTLARLDANLPQLRGESLGTLPLGFCTFVLGLLARSSRGHWCTCRIDPAEPSVVQSSYVPCQIRSPNPSFGNRIGSSIGGYSPSTRR